MWGKGKEPEQLLGFWVSSGVILNLDLGGIPAWGKKRMDSIMDMLSLRWLWDLQVGKFRKKLEMCLISGERAGLRLKCWAYVL